MVRNGHCYVIDDGNSFNSVNLRKLQPGSSTDVFLRWSEEGKEGIVVKGQRYKDQHEDSLRVMLSLGGSDESFVIPWGEIKEKFKF